MTSDLRKWSPETLNDTKVWNNHYRILFLILWGTESKMRRWKIPWIRMSYVTYKNLNFNIQPALFHKLVDTTDILALFSTSTEKWGVFHHSSVCRSAEMSSFILKKFSFAFPKNFIKGVLNYTKCLFQFYWGYFLISFVFFWVKLV